jgi:DNA-binding response OmpR family regulator
LKLLVIDEYPVIADSIRLSLRERGHVANVAHTGGHGRMFAMVHDYDTLVLSCVLPYITAGDGAAPAE